MISHRKNKKSLEDQKNNQPKSTDGRWISRDSLEEEEGDGANLYSYVVNDPLNRIDSLDLKSCAADGGFGKGGGKAKGRAKGKAKTKREARKMIAMRPALRVVTAWAIIVENQESCNSRYVLDND